MELAEDRITKTIAKRGKKKGKTVVAQERTTSRLLNGDREGEKEKW